MNTRLLWPRRSVWRLLCLLPVLGSLCGCRSAPPPITLRPDEPAPRVRFLLTFDDGPSARTDFNPTLAILDQLAENDLQPDICALFFVQPLHPRGGGTPLGREIMRRIHERRHVLGLHSVSPEGHVAHPTLCEAELLRRLSDAKRLLATITGADPLFVCPPYGARTPGTRRCYETLGLNLLLSDLRARDGVIYGYIRSPRRRSHFRRSLARLREQLPDTPPGAPPHPLLVTFHDLNPYTARLMTEYLHILVEESGRVGLRLADPPFFSTSAEVTLAGLQRRIPPPDTVLRADWEALE